MNLFAPVLLGESHFSQDGCKDHPRTMDPGQGLVQADGPARFRARYFGRPDRKVSSRAIQSHRRRTQSGMQVTGGAARLPSAGERGTDERGGEGLNGYQTEPLMDLEHVRTFVKERLGLGIALGLSRSDAEILQRWLLSGCWKGLGPASDLARRWYCLVFARPLQGHNSGRPSMVR